MCVGEKVEEGWCVWCKRVEPERRVTWVEVSKHLHNPILLLLLQLYVMTACPGWPQYCGK